eukprot:m.249040 g.249040  ORF g.249040 m.249040 type:complete len:386 (-) comp17506_c1_seq1:178-1335(-)
MAEPRRRTSTIDLAGEQGVLIQELNKGQPCLDCSSCPGFELHVWKKSCKHCGCPTRRHKQASGPAKPEVGLLEFVEEVPDDFDHTGYSYQYDESDPKEERPRTPPRRSSQQVTAVPVAVDDEDDDYADLQTTLQHVSVAPPSSTAAPPPRPPKTTPATSSHVQTASITMSGGPAPTPSSAPAPPRPGPRHVVAAQIPASQPNPAPGRPTSYDPHSLPAQTPGRLEPARNATQIVRDDGPKPPPVGTSFSSGAAGHGMPPELEELYGDGSDLYPGYSYDTEYCYWEIVHNVDRLTAEAVLTDYASNTGDIRGLYLIRHSSKVAGAIVVSMYDKSRLFHYQFLPTPTGTFLDDKGKDRGSLSQLVTHYEKKKEGMARELGTCLGPAA